MRRALLMSFKRLQWTASHYYHSYDFYDRLVQLLLTYHEETLTVLYVFAWFPQIILPFIHCNVSFYNGVVTTCFHWVCMLWILGSSWKSIQWTKWHYYLEITSYWPRPRLQHRPKLGYVPAASWWCFFGWSQSPGIYMYL
jgi:hypothetical protein